jgi:hypothetical protein
MAFQLNSKYVYDAKYIKEQQPSYFVGCTTNIAKIIKKKTIPQSAYMYASYSKVKGWTVLDYDSNYSKKKLLFTKQWVEANILTRPEEIDSDTKTLPDVLELDEGEKFVDTDGKLVEIMVRGVRDIDGIYFNASDIGAMLSIANITNTFTKEFTRFEKGKHYVYFMEKCNGGNSRNSKNSRNSRNGKNRYMYLTYYGLVRLLFVSTEDVADHFQKWAFGVLFKAQLGTSCQKQELVSDVLGLNIQSIRSFLNTGMTSMPTLYLLELGKVGELREVFSIPNYFKDEEVVLKFGLTNDLSRRLMEHEKSYGKLIKRAGCEIRLKYHAYIDTIYLYEAEKEISDYFKNVNWNLEHDTFKELACVSNLMLNNVVHGQFKSVGRTYCGKLHDLQVQITTLLSENERIAIDSIEKIDYWKGLLKERDDRMREKDDYMSILLKEKDEKSSIQNELIRMLKSK